MNKTKKSSSAFTIVELIITITIIGILAAITAVAYYGMSRKALEAGVKSDLNGANKQILMFQALNDKYPDTIRCDIPDGVTNQCIKSGQGARYDYVSDNVVKPATYSITITKDDISYEIVNGSSPQPAVAVDLPTNGSSVTQTTTGSSTIFSWGAVTCASGTSARYQYRYTNSSGYDSGLVLTNNNSFTVTTSNEGYTYTLEVQSQCYSSYRSSDWVGAGTVSYTRPMTAPSAPVITVALNAGNVVATVTPVTCGTGATAQYGIRSRINDGTWGLYSTWSATLTASQSASQGIKYGYQAQARCYATVGTSSTSTGAEGTYSYQITTPSTPTATASTSGSTTTFSWSSVTCSAGTANYQYYYSINSGYNSGWTATTSTTFAANTATEGYTYTIQVQSRCSTAQINSAWSSSSTSSYTRPTTLLNGTTNYALSNTPQSQSLTTTIPGLVSITSVSTSNGSVSYSNSGTTAYFNVYGGSASTGSTPSTTWNPTKYSKTATGTVGPQASTTFPTTKSYNDGSYSGTLNYTGRTTNTGPSCYVNFTWTQVAGVGDVPRTPSTETFSWNPAVVWDSNKRTECTGYRGTITFTGWNRSATYWDGARTVYYSMWTGTLYGSSTYTGNYSGTVYMGGNDTTYTYYNYYYYYLTVNYKYR